MQIGARITELAKRQPLLLMLAGAFLTALTLIFPTVGILEWLTMIPMVMGLFLFCESPHATFKKSYAYGFLTVYFYYFLIYHWFTNLYPLDFAGLDNGASLAVIGAGWLGLPLLQAIPGGLVFLIYYTVHKTRMLDRLPLLRPFLFASLWVIFEWSSTLSWTGVPWGRLCLGQIKLLPMLQSASLFGSYFVSFLLLTVNGLLVCAILSGPKRMLCGMIAAALFASNLAFGAIDMLLPEQNDSPRVTVAVVQGNVDSREKWGADSYRITTERYANYTRRAVAEGAELVVWPESAIPYFITHDRTARTFVSNLAKECGVTLIVGGFARDGEKNEYNALYMVSPDGTVSEDFYAKRHLVPFGEYVPMRNLIMTLIPPLANVSMLEEDLTPGEDSGLFETAWGSVGSLICFDSIYDQLTGDSVRDGANLLIVSSNDNWFFDSKAVYQHQAQAQLRAIESGRYLARAGNTGISSVIGPDGEILAWIDPLIEGYAVQEVAFESQQTLYTLIGNTFVYLCGAFALCVALIGAYRGKKRLA